MLVILHEGTKLAVLDTWTLPLVLCTISLLFRKLAETVFGGHLMVTEIDSDFGGKELRCRQGHGRVCLRHWSAHWRS